MVRQAAHWAKAAGQEAAMEPVAKPGAIGLVPLEFMEDADWRPGSPLEQKARFPQFPLQKDEVVFRVSADAILGPSKRPASMKHVVRRRIEIQAGSPVFVPERPLAVGVGLQLQARPIAHLTSENRIKDELNLGRGKT
jgi:hypothetical protein